MLTILHTFSNCSVHITLDCCQNMHLISVEQWCQFQFLTSMKNVGLCNDHCWAGRLAGQVVIRCGRNCNVSTVLDAINVMDRSF